MNVQPNGKVRVYDPGAYKGTGAYQEKWPVDAQEQLARGLVFASKKEADKAAKAVKEGKKPDPPKTLKKTEPPKKIEPPKKTEGDTKPDDYGDWKLKALKSEVEGRELTMPDPPTKEDIIALLKEDDDDE